MRYTILTSSRSAGISNGLTYESDDDIAVGSAVRIPLRKQIVEGIVLEIQKSREEEFDVKAIESVMGDMPLLSEAYLRLLQWMSEYYFCTLRQAAQVFLPGMEWRKYIPKETEEFPVPETHAIEHPHLSDDQKTAIDVIQQSNKPTLLFGVTGSGKTEVYAELIAQTIAEGKQALLLVPEIFLTEHSIDRFTKLVGRDRIAVLHSQLTPAQRRNVWKQVRFGHVDMVIGSRSALFAPLEHLGLIIVDEEHEWTYKNEQTPRYHARNTAQKLSELTGAQLVLGTATPSLEVWERVVSGQFAIATLPKRYGDHPLPPVKIVDLAEVNFGQWYPFSTPLLQAIDDRLKRGEQSVLFLNRRGSATALLCFDCRRRVVSPDSQLPFTVHQHRDGSLQLVDHTSNLKLSPPERCPHCQSANLKMIGAGTQKVEQLLQARFPTARVLRADADTLIHTQAMKDVLEKMRTGEADILLGTQSVVKGLDLPNVTLAAVLLADVGLSLPTFRAGERIFQLLSQLAGRSGRAKPGDVIIQTYRPEAREIQLAAMHDTKEFLQTELKLRIHAEYPPASRMIRFLLRGENVHERTKALHRDIQRIIDRDDLKLFLSYSPTLFGGGKEWHVIVRGHNPRVLLAQLDLAGIVVDVDPIDCV